MPDTNILSQQNALSTDVEGYFQVSAPFHCTHKL